MSDEISNDDIIKNLKTGNHVFYYSKLYELTRHIPSAVVISYLLYRSNVIKSGWIKISDPEWLKTLGLKRPVMEHVRKICCDELKVVDKLNKRYRKKDELRGHGTYHYKINKTNLYALLKQLPSMQETSTLDDDTSMQETSTLEVPSMQETSTLLLNKKLKDKNQKETTTTKSAENQSQQDKELVVVVNYYFEKFGVEVIRPIKEALKKMIDEGDGKYIKPAIDITATDKGRNDFKYFKGVFNNLKNGTSKPGEKNANSSNKSSRPQTYGNVVYLKSSPTSEATAAAARTVIERKRKANMQ